MFKDKITSKIIFSIFLFALSIGAANAIILAPGSTVALPGTTSAAEPQLAGLIVVDDLVGFSYLSGGGTVTGSVQVRVVEAVDNTVDFYWRVFNDSSSDDSIGSFRFGNFFTDEYNANFRIDGLGDDAPDSAHRFLGAQDSFVNFNFTDGLSAGDSSNFFFMDTDATAYAKTAIYDFANLGHTQISSSFDMYAPFYDVPEPPTVLLLGLGLLGLTIYRKKST